MLNVQCVLSRYKQVKRCLSIIFFKYSFRYIITRIGEPSPKIIDYDEIPSSERITTSWSGLRPGRTYTFTVECEVQGEECQGAPVTFTVTTASCSSMWISQLFLKRAKEQILIEYLSKSSWIVVVSFYFKLVMYPQLKFLIFINWFYVSDVSSCCF